MFPRIRYALRNQQGEGGAGGNAGNTAQPNNANAQQSADAGAQQPQFMTSDQFNRAWTERERRLQASFDRRLEELQAKLSPSRDEQPAQPNANAQGENPNEARFKALEKKLAEREAQLEAESSKRARTEEQQLLRAALEAQGITGARATVLVSHLHGAAGAVRRNKDGRVVFAIERDGYDDELDVAKGVEEWLKTPEGKELAPPRQVGGSGTDPKQRGNVGGAHQKPVRGEALLRALTGGNG